MPHPAFRLRVSTARHSRPLAAPTWATGTRLGSRLHYVLRNEQGDVVDEQYEPVPATAATSWQPVRLGVRVPEAGTLEVAVVSEHRDYFVYFDDIQVEHTGGMIVQEQHQYAYGSPLTGLNYVVGSKRYRHGYQGQYAERDEQTGYESFELRLYHSRLGRWMSYDPYGQFASPYVGMGNNPVSSTDPDGGWCCGGGPVQTALNGGTIGEVVVRGVASGAYMRLGLDAARHVAFYAGQYTYGFYNALGNDMGLGLPSYFTRGTPELQELDGVAGFGQTMGHVTGLGIGLVTTGAGLIGQAGGGALVISGVGTVPGGAVLAGSTAGVVYGAGVTTSAWSALTRPKPMLESRGKLGEGGFKKNPQGDNTKINEQVTSLVKKYKLDRNEQRQLHDQITGRGLTRKEIGAEILELWPSKAK
ncbi:RHS repeat-associated core domain-containing protein [Hymenobacter weizhouensis]|uniref:RHS repeat-associated core domain-containing protein n=1 Tax=Hymenobacter sp. YIM 151500-1 TaxID=2987689 RepID=UPI00222640D0|nr:RHS repeat-associated core domain-containing protein [Hymenobacter sp. YIM 151500-1]UYZ62537.1 hypothetical protein OIS53_16245 [Hymenobacter sp. YIM 151500-1]